MKSLNRAFAVGAFALGAMGGCGEKEAMVEEDGGGHEEVAGVQQDGGIRCDMSMDGDISAIQASRREWAASDCNKYPQDAYCNLYRAAIEELANSVMFRVENCPEEVQVAVREALKVE